VPTFEISDELAEQLAEQLCTDGATEVSSIKDFVGSKLFIRTVTYHMVGKVVAVKGNLIELASASVVFESGPLTKALKDGTLANKESVGKMWVNFASVTDIFPWSHAL
jgi:hypothetical protein